jgi:hypothetical protein
MGVVMVAAVGQGLEPEETVNTRSIEAKIIAPSAVVGYVEAIDELVR